MQVMKLAAFGTLLLAFAVVAGGSAVIAGQACRPGVPTPQSPRASTIPDARDKPEGNPKAETEKDDDIVWGKTVGGLQAGIAFKGGRRSYRIGEVVPIVVRLRNVSEKALVFDYSDGFFFETPPAVTDADGKPARLSIFATLDGLWRRLRLSLAAGQTVDFGSLDLALVPADGNNDSGKPALFAAPGTYSIHYERLPPFRDSDPTKVLSTGKIDLEVKAAEPLAKAKGDLEGRWQAVSFDQDGRVPLGVDVKDVVAEFQGDKYHFTTGMRAKGAGKGKLTVHADTDPKSFEFTPDSGVFEGMAFRGIYRLKDDTLTLCFSWPPKDRPSEFASPPDSTVVLAVFKPLKP